MAAEVLSRTFKASRVSRPVSLLLRLQIISCVILNVGAVWFKCYGECRVSAVYASEGLMDTCSRCMHVCVEGVCNAT